MLLLLKVSSILNASRGLLFKSSSEQNPLSHACVGIHPAIPAISRTYNAPQIAQSRVCISYRILVVAATTKAPMAIRAVTANRPAKVGMMEYKSNGNIRATGR